MTWLARRGWEGVFELKHKYEKGALIVFYFIYGFFILIMFIFGGDESRCVLKIETTTEIIRLDFNERLRSNDFEKTQEIGLLDYQ